jgi:hypothetical protein
MRIERKAERQHVVHIAAVIFITWLCSVATRRQSCGA